MLQKGQIEAIITETATLPQQLNKRMPDVGGAQAAVKRDCEASDELKESFSQVEAQFVEMKTQSEAVTGAQREIHTVVARPKADLENVQLEVGKYVTEVLASVQTTGGGAKGGGDDRREREGPQLNSPKTNEFELFADNMTKA